MGDDDPSLDRRAVLGAAVGGLTGLSGCSADEPDDCPRLPTEPNYRGYLDQVDVYEATCDFRDEETVTVAVGGRGQEAFWEFRPVAIAVTPGTTVTWEWTGRGGAHDVVSVDEIFSSGRPTSEAGETFEFEFATPGIYRYYCTPHRSVHMKGVVFVSLE